MKNSALSAAIFSVLLLIISCAQVVAPGGGPIDKTPPKVLSYSPDSAKLNFDSRSIEIVFDEYIQLRDLNNQLIISPLMNNPPDIRVKGKTLIIELDKKETLKPNTTYAINFGNALQDYNESNPKENFKYIFSTGNFIDSLTVKGKVQNTFDHKTEKGIMTMLYSDMDDSTVYNRQPDYFAKTNTDGTFKINNIKNGTYRIVALKDANANYKYDGETESIGFVNAPINTSEKKNILIELFQEPAKKVFLKKYIHDQYGKITLIFNQGSDSLRVVNLSNDKRGVQELLDFSRNKDTLTYWIKNYLKDSLKLQVNNGNKILDTVEFKMIKREDALKSKKNPLKLSLLSSPDGNMNFDLGSELKLVFNNPISSVNNNEPLHLKEDTVLQKNKYLNFFYDFSTVKITDTIVYENPKNPGVMISSPRKGSPQLKENTNYHLLIPPGTFTDFFGLTNDSIKIDFKTKEEKFYGNMVLKITIPETKTNYIIQLLSDKENVIRENNIKKAETLTYPYIYPGNYKLKIIYDTNNNGKWDSGNYLKKQQAEKVIYYKELINVRSNWDLDLEWKVTNNE